MIAARRRRAPEVVQTSAMDCGPAALKCLLEGHGIPVSYGRLREACQTDVDGTSIDTVEVVANQLGLDAEQMMLPLNHLFLAGAAALPALVVVRQPTGGTHFVVVWRQRGAWLEVMDPATGRRWARRDRFMEEIHRHEASVPAQDWREWAGSEACLAALRERMARIGMGGGEGRALLDKALADPGWFGLGALDASLRLVGAVVTSGGLPRGGAAARLLRALFERTLDAAVDIYRAVPPAYWTVTPDPTAPDPIQQHLILRGAALIRVAGRSTASVERASEPLSPELSAALREKPVRPLRPLWDLLRGEGVFRPAALLAAMSVAVGAVLIETLLFRALLDVAGLLNLASQRFAAMGALLLFAALVMALEVPIATESMRLGRHLEICLRMALLRKLPHLPDRYFQSRPLSDMADRGHGLHVTRSLPGMAVHLTQALCELALTLLGVILIAPESAPLAAVIVVLAVLAPLLTQPLLRERDLRVRNHVAALGSFYLDALLGLVPVRAHRAEGAVRRQHESLLVEWARAARSLLGLSVVLDAVQSFLGAGLAGVLLFRHFQGAAGVTGGDLLLVFWVLKLPAIGHGLATLARLLPMQRNTLVRLMEPLAAPEDIAAETTPPDPPRPRRAAGMAIVIDDGTVVASGHTILRDVTLTIAPGEHVAIVGPSGAGKSTLIGLLLGWHRLSRGTLRVDDAPPDAATLRRETAWVDPAIRIWNRSFSHNLGYASEDGGLGRIGEVIEDAHLRGVLSELPEGLNTRLGEGGALLSGGEGQRVRLGRAFAREGVRLALLDEPFRGMDRERRGTLLASARKRWAEVTLLCVTHDVGETLAFDRVLVVEEGRIIEDGAPARLAATASRYQRLLRAEREVLNRTWAGSTWRRLSIREGRVRETT